MGLEQNIQKQLKIPISHILQSHNANPNHPTQMSITSIFDASALGKIILAFIPKNIHINNKQVSNYEDVWELLKECVKKIGMEIGSLDEPSDKFLGKAKIDYQEEAIQEEVWADLRQLCKILFHIMLKNQEVLYQITKMQQKCQLQIKQYIESSQQFNDSKMEIDSPNNRSFNKSSSNNFHHEQTLVDKIDQLEHALLLREQELSKAKEKMGENREELAMMKSVLQEKEGEIGVLKKRIEAYSEADLLFQEKDDEIAKLNSQLTELKLKTHIKATQQTNQILKLKQKYSQLQSQKNQLAATNEQLANKNELLTLNKQESETTNKKVIANLKQKIKSLNDRLAQQQKNMMDVLMQKQQRDKQLFELEKKNNHNESIKKSKIAFKHDDIRNSARKSSKLVDQLGDISNLLDQSQDNFKYYQVLFGDMHDRCTGEMCIALRSEYVRVVQQILDINNDIDSLTYITPKNRLECILKQLEKIHQAVQQNLKLKQKLVLLQSETGRGQSSKESMQQINKQKKKILIMKRHLEEVESKRKQQIEILIAAIGQSSIFGAKK